jgi:hypothetical protein
MSRNPGWHELTSNPKAIESTYGSVGTVTQKLTSNKK